MMIGQEGPYPNRSKSSIGGIETDVLDVIKGMLRFKDDMHQRRIEEVAAATKGRDVPGPTLARYKMVTDNAIKALERNKSIRNAKHADFVFKHTGGRQLIYQDYVHAYMKTYDLFVCGHHISKG